MRESGDVTLAGLHSRRSKLGSHQPCKKTRAIMWCYHDSPESLPERSSGHDSAACYYFCCDPRGHMCSRSADVRKYEKVFKHLRKIFAKKRKDREDGEVMRKEKTVASW